MDNRVCATRGDHAIGWCSTHGRPMIQCVQSCPSCAAKDKECKRLRRSLEAAQFTDAGGELWKPPVQNKGVFTRLEDKNRHLQTALDAACDWIAVRNVQKSNEFRKAKEGKQDGAAL